MLMDNVRINTLNRKDEGSRRKFLLASTRGLTGALTLAGAPAILASQTAPDKIKVGLIGCRRRGAHAIKECLSSSSNVELIALADLFPYNMETGLKLIRSWEGIQDRINIKYRFFGIDSFREMMQTEIDLVLLETPPHFRPAHLRAAVEAGKHVFMEKPVAVDPVGVRSIIASSEMARKKGLAIVAGTQRRHDKRYIETISRIHDGAIGDLVSGECYWNTGFIHYHDRKPGWSDMEFQINNWLYFTWVSGDHVVEQHVHNVDIINWLFRAHPKRATSIGGRQVRTGLERWGNIYDHFCTEFIYPDGRGGEVTVTSTCRQIEGCANHVAEYAVGTKGRVRADGLVLGENPFRFAGHAPNSRVQSHADLIASIHAGKPLNEGRTVAESTMACIIARMSAYSGQPVTWDWAMNESQLDYTPPNFEMGPKPVDPVPVPGKTPLV